MFSMKETIEALKPKWDYRRKFVAWLLAFVCLMITITLGGALFLGFLSKFNIFLSAFLIVFAICSFMVLLGIIGSYIFGSRWETADFLKVLPGIIPHMVPDSNNTDVDEQLDNHNSAGDSDVVS
jgi:hypothetical protein